MAEADAGRGRAGDPALWVVGGFIAYAALFLAVNSLSVGGQRYFAVLDDALISMRYGRHWVQGHGLVWNVGAERVEGITNPLWAMALGLLHLLPLPLPWVVLVALALSGACLGANLWLAGKLTRRLAPGRGAGPAVLAMVLTALYLPLNTWALQGMEVGLVAALVTGAAYLAVGAADEGRFDMRPHLLLAIGVWARLDVAVAWLALTFGWAWAQPRSARRVVLAFVGLAGASLGLQTLWRRLYFGEWLPNTYYLKMTGVSLATRLGTGLPALWTFVEEFSPLLLVLPLVWAMIALRRPARILVAVVVAQLAYSAYVGGDFEEQWHGANRFISSTISLSFCLLGVALADWAHRALPAAAPTARRAFLWTLGLLAFLEVNSFNRTSLLAAALLSPPQQVIHLEEQVLRQVKPIEELTDPQARVAVVWAGTVPYYTDRPAVDLLGKSDAAIARQPVPEELLRAMKGYWPGHMKWSYARSLGGEPPDVITQLWSLPDPTAALALTAAPVDARPFLLGRYVRVEVDGAALLLRRDSPHVRWDLVPKLASRVADFGPRPASPR